jgi:predicted GNAT family N-acyltransferase
MTKNKISTAVQIHPVDPSTKALSTNSSALLSLTSPQHGFTAKVVELTTQTALVQTSSRGAVHVGQEITSIQVMLDERRVAGIPKALVVETRPVEEGALVSLRLETAKYSDMYQNQRIRGRARVSRPASARIIAKHPVNAADEVHFQVEDVSTDGMRLSTSLRNRFILPDMHFTSATAALGHFAEFQFDFVTVHCSVDEPNNRLVVGVRYIDMTDYAKQTLAGFIITNQEGAAEPSLLEVSGLHNRSTSTRDIVRYTIATTMQHFLDLQMMRWRAQIKNGRIDPQKTLPEHMLDSYDRRSKIVLGYVGEELVASVRLTSCEAEGERFEIESFVDLEDRYDRGNTMEISRAWIIPELHGTDIVYGMIEFVANAFADSGRDWLVTSCKSEVLEFYAQMGFRETGYTFQHPENGATYHVVEIESVRAVRAVGSNPINWLYTYARVQEFLVSRGYERTTWFRNGRLRLYRKIASAALQIINNKKAA